MTWLAPAAFWGLTALAVPILVHLLTRHERRIIQFPSLQFLTATRLAATSQHRIRDWLLLAVRAATIAAAVAALAGPLLVTASRERQWSARTARAIVGIGDAQAPVDEVQSAYSSHVVPAGARVPEAMRAAVEWLATQPPSARELLIVGDLRDGMVDDGDVARVPAHVGIRFLPIADVTPAGDVTVPVLTLRDRRPVVEERRVHLNARDTVVEDEATRMPPGSAPRLEVRASPEDQRAADAALAALLDEGIVVDASRRVIVVWPGGAEPSVSDDQTQVVRLVERPSGAGAVATLRQIAAEALDDPTTPREPRRASAADLARWSRPPGQAPSDAIRQDEGDRRVLWGLALALLVVEWLLRRAERPRVGRVGAADEEELVA